MSMLDQRDFVAAMAREGVHVAEVDRLRMDGVLCRFSTSDRDRYRRQRNGWAVIFTDGPRPVVTFGDWSQGISQTVVVGGEIDLSAAERERQRIALEQARTARQAELRARHASAAREAERLWSTASAACEFHPYLMRKTIDAHGLRERGGFLLVPLRNDRGDLMNVQKIRADGQKRFLRGGRVAGLYASIGVVGDHLLLCEGWATAKSLHRATGLPVAVAFSSGNLLAVAEVLRRKYPASRITVCADNDFKPDGSNPGVKAATAAAMAVGGHLAIPPSNGDFNDFYAAGPGNTAMIEVFTSESSTR